MSLTDNENALPCPKCGCDEIAYGYSLPPFLATVECFNESCRAAVVDHESELNAIMLWNGGFWNGTISVDDDGFSVFNPISDGEEGLQDA